ncbi:uncharacterized protein BO80DRAFT_93410 [Aspergillus ibericus CBS 121593]|uniref:Uncharacterized protein n=1 Tax=Aspergillus ibericus CBS 121593 TaxID=1448316 RepID=A0A395GYC8_9EURO|nr:hypothetical protein BO80DRAFT_93410 [Aspergillus ibericus CBS 121593]RAL00622.1 hypothetical protein BO80DRAFT_93410 [Aspergillus ibericus CBS 121593]
MLYLPAAALISSSTAVSAMPWQATRRAGGRQMVASSFVLLASMTVVPSGSLCKLSLTGTQIRQMGDFSLPAHLHLSDLGRMEYLRVSSISPPGPLIYYYLPFPEPFLDCVPSALPYISY